MPGACGVQTAPPLSRLGPRARFLILGAALALIHPSLAAQPTDLTTMSLEQLLAVTVSGAAKYEQKQSEVAAATSVITRQEIKTFGWRTLADALASLPGVATTYDRQYSYLGVRGFGLPGDFNTRTLVTINGNRVNDALFDQGPVGRDFPVDMEMVERIEFIPGPGGAVYGQNAMFGVINVVTRNGSDLNGGELVAAYQQPQGLREGSLSWGKRLDNGVDVVVSGSGLQAQGEDLFFNYGTSGKSGVAAGMNGERNRQFFTRLAYGAWSFEFLHGDHRQDDPTGSYKADPLVAGQFQGDRHDLAQLQYREKLADNTLEVLGRVFAGSEKYSTLLVNGGVPTATPGMGDWQGAELRLLSTAVDRHKLMLGLEHQVNTRQDQYILNLANPANNISILKTGYRTGLYVQDEWRIGDTLTATLGLRLDTDDVTGTKTSPRAGLVWQASAATTVKTLYGHAHRSPNAFENMYANGVSQVANPALKGEAIDTLELVADHRVDRELVLRASTYQWTLYNPITLGIDAVSGLSQYQTGPTVTARGVELSADKTWATGARLRASLSRQDVTYADGSPLVNASPLLGKLNLSSPLPWAGLRLGYEWRYDSQRRSLDGSELGGYALSNLYLSSQTYAKGVEWSLGINNLFDKRYAQPAASNNWQNAFEQDGRSVRMQMRYRF